MTTFDYGKPTTVILEQARYEQLLALETKVNLMRDFMEKDGYITDSTIRMLFGFPEKEEKDG